MPSALLVLTTLPDQETAENLARGLVDARVAACVNILAPCRSIYRWRGEIRTEGEVPMLIKTSQNAYPALENWLRQAHPYELPEIVAVPVEAGLNAYLGWIAQETQ